MRWLILSPSRSYHKHFYQHTSRKRRLAAKSTYGFRITLADALRDYFIKALLVARISTVLALHSRRFEQEFLAESA
jgi:hypothetical protein